MKTKLIKIEFFQKEFHVIISNNGHQWNTVFRSQYRDETEIIERAYISVGYSQSKQTKNKEEFK